MSRPSEEARLMRIEDDLTDALLMLRESSRSLAGLRQESWSDEVTKAYRHVETIQTLVTKRLTFIRAMLEGDQG